MTFILPKSIVSTKGGKLFHVPNVIYENRYCNQDDFSIFVCGGTTEIGGDLTASRDVYELKCSTFQCSKFASMLKARYDCKTAVINSDVIVVGGYNNAHKRMDSVELFRPSTCFIIINFN